MTTPPPDPRFDSIRAVLAVAVGRARAITLQSIADQLSLSRREVESVIEERLADFPFVLVAGADGLFVPTTAGDINRYRCSLHSRHAALRAREESLVSKARAQGWPYDGSAFADPPSTQGELFTSPSAWR